MMNGLLRLGKPEKDGGLFRGYAGVLIILALLLSPFFVDWYRKGPSADIFSITTLWNFLVSITFIAAIFFLCRKAFKAALLLFPVVVSVIIELSVLSIYGSRLSAGIIWIGWANLGETGEFAQTYGTQIFIVTVGVLVLYATALFLLRNIQIRPPVRFRYAVVVLFLAVYLMPGIRIMTSGLPFNKIVLDMLEHDLSIPFVIPAQSAAVFLNNLKLGESLAQREEHSFGATLLQDSDVTSNIHVLIIGESARKQNWSLYGYGRDTTPRLRERKNLVVFEDAISNWALTQRIVPIMLTRADVLHPDTVLKEKSILSAIGEAGYETFWITAQPFDRFAGAINWIALEAKTTIYVSRAYDRALLEHFRQIVTTHGGHNLFIVLHTKGSHFNYRNRYPRDFARFNDGRGVPYRERVKNAYDNTIFYTDAFIDEVITILEQTNFPATVTYISDHGENLFDDDRKLLGHNYGTSYEVMIPFLFWYSDDYAKTNPDVVEAARRNRLRPVEAQDLFESLADIVRIDFDGLDRHRSPFNAAYENGNRYVYVQKSGQVVDFDAEEQSMTLGLSELNP